MKKYQPRIKEPRDHPLQVFYRGKDQWEVCRAFWDYRGFHWIGISMHSTEASAEKEARRLIGQDFWGKDKDDK